VPANWGARRVLVDQRHDECGRIDARPFGHPIAQRQQKRRQMRCDHATRIVRPAEERDAPPRGHAMHLEGREFDAGDVSDERRFLIRLDEAFAIVKAVRKGGLEQRADHPRSLSSARICSSP
jgi:hypothetical protein